MQPFIVDPNTYRKEEAFEKSKAYVFEFLAMNAFGRPTKLITTKLKDDPRDPNKWRDHGWYKFNTKEMFVNVKKSRTPVKTPGFQWSYTGFKADLTAPGTLAHETGHHVHNLLNRRFPAREILSLLRKVADVEERVSSYEPDVYEVFAEAMRLFIMNPELLREGRPVRWALLREHLGLIPPHEVPWREILINAHPKIILAAQNWIKKGLQMTQFNVPERTIFYTIHGSHAYGLNIPTSDKDYKGVCIPPRSVYLGFTQRFEQLEHMGSKTDGVDSVIYALSKFASLASECNPNIMEILHVSDSDIVNMDEFGEALRSIKDQFVSKKAKHTFSGYAHAQLKRIKTHRAWLLNPPKDAPKRSDFGISETPQLNQSELGAIEAIEQGGKADTLPENVMSLFRKEMDYKAAKTHFDQYVSWKKSRNPARAELESKFSYDVKHAMHLLRLMRMCVEILETGKVNVKRHDRDELLKVRFGERSYDSLIEEAEALEAKSELLYKTSSLRNTCDKAAIDTFIIDLTDRYIKKHG